MKPFSTPVLAKRTYRELKLLKHLRHENVSPPGQGWLYKSHSVLNLYPGHLTQRHFHLASRGHVGYPRLSSLHGAFEMLTLLQSYFVTELLGTDLHRLLTSRPLEKQFIQYFLYQIMVCSDPALGVSEELANTLPLSAV